MKKCLKKFNPKAAIGQPQDELEAIPVEKG
jgi:hypothetical protein